MKTKIKLLHLSLTILVVGCQMEQSNDIDYSKNKFSDATIQQIYELQDRRDTKNLLPFLTNEKTIYRKEAALAFGSMQDSMALESLHALLKDDVAEIRVAAAYAIGQTGKEISQTVLINAITREEVPLVINGLLEALGKCINLSNLSVFEEFSPSDSLEKSGLAWGIYRAGVREIHSSKTIKQSVGFLDISNSYQTRLGAANFLMRTRDIQLNNYLGELKRSLLSEPAPSVRMALARAIGKIDTMESVVILSSLLKKDLDYRVRINAILALGSLNSDDARKEIITSLNDSHFNVRIAAAEFLSRSPEADGVAMFELAKNSNNWRVKSLLLKAAIDNDKRKSSQSNYVYKEIKNTSNNYAKAAFMSALESDFEAFEYLKNQLLNFDTHIIGTTAASTLTAMRRKENFPKELEAEFAKIFKESFDLNDLAIMGIVSDVISDPELNFKETYQDYSFLTRAKERLSLPGDIEALQIVEAAIAYFEEKEVDEPKTEFNHPINWELVKNISPNQVVSIKTSKGEITVEMLVEDSPGSVANFLDQAAKGYYNGKNFHRVVPNFVIQGGCPRGDGWGSEDYSIRSEFGPLKYQQGYMGMASAGKDTEGVQWFITHSPTPHLDGRYTIFAKVVKGMDVVHQIEVGDLIESIEIPNGI